jgi:hypothetical protein
VGAVTVDAMLAYRTFFTCIFTIKFQIFIGEEKHTFPRLSYALVPLIGAFKVSFCDSALTSVQMYSFARSVNKPTTSYFCSQQDFHFILKESATI